VRRRIFTITCVYLCLCGALEAASRAHVRITFRPVPPISADIRVEAISEAARIWLPYGVVIESDLGPPPTCDGRIVPLAIETDMTRPSGRNEDAIGSARFAADGAPESTIVLYYATAVRLAVSAPLFGQNAALLPARLRDQAIARTLGRALAHEVGHVLLRWKHHSSVGLMQAQQRASTLTAEDPGPFRLTSDEVSRLRAALAFGEVPGRDCPVLASAATTKP
jgi:hypothetical protein